jgi:RNA polymerase sigma factor (sigma-70 family)
MSRGGKVLLPAPDVSSQISSAAASVAAAADAVYVEHAPLLRAIALTRFKVPPADVDALVHDVFASYFVNAAGVRMLRAYLVGGICNAARQYWRKRDAERAVLCDAVPCPASADDELSESIARKVRIAAVLARLRPKCRDLLRRYYLEEESTASIAASRQTTPATVLVLLHGCRKSARAIFRTLGEE